MTLSSHAPFDEHGWGMIIRDMEYLYQYVAGSNDVAQDTPQSVAQSNAEPQAADPPQLTGFDGIGGAGNLGQPASQQAAQTANPVAYPIVPAKGGTGLTTIPAHGVMLGEGTANVTTAAPGTAGLSLVSNGASSDPSFQAITIASTTGTLAIARGGTASASALTASAVMVSNGSAIIQGPVGTTTTVLHGNAAGAPSYAAVDLTADVTGILPIANGGTNANTAANARTSLGLGTIATQNANNVNITGGYNGNLRYLNQASFTASGSWTPPAGVTCALFLITGGGGGGGGAAAATATGYNCGGGGGAAGCTTVITLTVTPGSPVPFTVGAGGAGGGAGGGTGVAGGDSSLTGVILGPGGGAGFGSAFGGGTNGRGGRIANGFASLGATGAFMIPGSPGQSALLQGATVSVGTIIAISSTGGQGGVGINSNSGSLGGFGGNGADGGSNSGGGAGGAGNVLVYY